MGEGLIQWKEQPRIVLTVLVCQQIFKNVLYTEVYVTRSHLSLFSLDTGHKHSACYLQSEGAKEMRLRVACVIRRCPFVIDGLGAWRYV